MNSNFEKELDQLLQYLLEFWERAWSTLAILALLSSPLPVKFGWQYSVFKAVSNNTPIHSTFPCPLPQPPQPTSALNDVALPHLPRAFRGSTAVPAKQPKRVKQDSRFCLHGALSSRSLLTLSLCLENTVVTGSVRLIPDTQIDILMLSFFPSQSLFPSLKFAKSGLKLVVGPTNNSTLTRSPNITTFVQR